MTPISRGALAIGNKLVLGAKTFRKGLVSSLDFGKQTIGRTAEKINANNQRIKTEKKRQKRLDQQIEETKDRKEKEKLIEAKKATSPVGSIVKNVLRKPLEGLWKLIQAWAIANLPAIIEEIKKFVLKVRIFGAAIKRAVLEVGGIFKALVRITKAVLKNLSEFDFSDKSGRIKEAKQDLDDSMDEIRANFEEAQNVWGREEGELEEILRKLESGETMKDAVAAIESGAGVNLEPQNPAAGQQPSGPGNTATNTEWTPLLEIIAQAEARDGSYDSIYPNSIKPGLSQMTIGEADAWQARTASQRGSAAAGRYQFMNIKAQAAAAGIGENELFSPENQDKMAIALIEKKRKVTLDMLRNDPTEAARRLSMEWAGLPVLEQTKGAKRTVSRGQSFFSGDGRNKANVTPDQLTGAFASTLGANQGSAEPQQPQAPSGAFLTDQLFAKDFNTKDYNAPSPIIRTSDRGMRWGRMHNGVDFGTGGQTGWYCALLLDGKVTYVGYDSGGGNMVFITSGGVEYCFMHLARYAAGIREGAAYKAGQPIGEVGNTGTGTGIHLHFETRRPGSGASGSFNPDPYIKYVTFGKLKTRTVASASNTSGTSEARATEVATAAESKRTGGTQTKNKTTVVTQKEIVMVT